MNTPTQLRSVLEDHAGDIDTMPAHDRLGQVQGRIRDVRRRRRAGAAGVLAAVVAVAGTAVLWPRHSEPGPASRDLAGHTAPKTMQSLGYTYSFEEGDEGDGRAAIRLYASDKPRLIAWASESGDVELTTPLDLDGDGSVPDDVRGGSDDFADFHEIAPGVSGTFKATGDGQVALAVYTISATAPGVTKDGTTFRSDIAGDTLVAAAIGDQGDSELTVHFTMPEGVLRLSEVCSGLPKGYQMNVELGDGLLSLGQCGVQTPFDGGNGYSTFTDGVADGNGEAIKPGDPVTARIWVTRASRAKDPSQEAVEAPGAHLGFAFYEVAPTVATVAGWDLPEQVEYDGHLWTYSDSTSRPAPSGRLQVPVDASGGPVLVQGMSSGNFRHTVRTLVDGRVASLSSGGGLGTVGMFVDGVHTVTIDGGRLGPRAEVGIALYRRE